MSTFNYRLRGLKAAGNEEGEGRRGGDGAAGRSGGPPAGGSADLVHENPLTLVLPFPLHQVPK